MRTDLPLPESVGTKEKFQTDLTCMVNKSPSQPPPKIHMSSGSDLYINRPDTLNEHSTRHASKGTRNELAKMYNENGTLCTTQARVFGQKNPKPCRSSTHGSLQTARGAALFTGGGGGTGRSARRRRATLFPWRLGLEHQCTYLTRPKLTKKGVRTEETNQQNIACTIH